MKTFTCLALLLICFFSCENVYSQTPSLQWIKTYKYSSTSNQQSWAVSTDDLGNIYVGVQAADDTSSQRIVVLKYDPDGNLLWNKIYNNPTGGFHSLYDLTSNGNGDVYVLGRYTSTTYGTWELIKYDTNGNLQWVKNSHPYGLPKTVKLDHNDDIIVCGNPVDSLGNVQISIDKYDKDGNLIWEKKIIPSVTGTLNTFNSLKIDSRNNIIIGATLAREYYIGSYDYNSYLFKYSSTGQLKWQRVYSIDSTEHLSNNNCTSLSIDNNDNIYFISYAFRTVPQLRTFVAQKYDSSGTLIWTDIYGNAEYDTSLYARTSTISNNKLVVAAELSHGTYPEDTTDVLITKYNEDGTIDWSKVWNINGVRYLTAQNALSDASGNIYVTGFATIDSLGNNTDVYSLKVNGNTGDVNWSDLYSSVPDSNQDETYAAVIDKYNNLIVDGYTYADYNNTLAPVFVIKYSLGPAGVKNNGPNILKSYKLYQNYPNPFNPTTTVNYTLPKASNVKIDIFNVLGEKVATLVNSFEKEGSYKVKWNADRFASGIYFYRITSGNFIQTKKMILLK